jgi:hypothetical protein
MQPPGPAWGAMTHAVQEKRGNVNALHTKAFTAWINHSLKGERPPVAAIGDCTKELGSGLVLIRLVEHFSRTKCPFPYKAAPANRTLCIDNVSVALKYLGQYVPNLAIAPADIVDGNTQVILGLLWRMILKWQNSLQVQRTQGEVGEQATATASESVVKTTKDAKCVCFSVCWCRCLTLFLQGEAARVDSLQSRQLSARANHGGLCRIV